MELSNESKQEIYRRLVIFMSNNNEWIPITYQSLSAFINTNFIKSMVKSLGFDDPKSYSALLLYLVGMFSFDDLMNVYRKEHGVISSKFKTTLNSHEVNKIKQEPKTVEYLNMFIKTVFEDVGPLNAECPFDRPAGVTNMYLQDLSPIQNYVINKHFDPKRKFDKDYFIELSQHERSETENIYKMFDYINEIYHDPVKLYEEYNGNPEIKIIIDYTNEETKQLILNQIELGRQLHFKTTIPPDMVTGTNGDYEFIEQMKCGLNDDISYDEQILNLIKLKRQRDYLIKEPNQSSIDGPTPGELLEYCSELVNNTTQKYEDTTTKSLVGQLWEKPLTKFAVAGAGIGALGLTSYGLYKLYQYNKQRREAEEQLEQLKQQQAQKPMKQRKNKPTIINNVGMPNQYNIPDENQRDYIVNIV